VILSNKKEINIKTGWLWIRFYISFLIAVVLTSCAKAAPVVPTIEPSPTEGVPSDTTITDILYATVQGNTLLDVYVPSASAPRPVVIVVHGGSQAAINFIYLSKALSEMGVLVYNINVSRDPPPLVRIKRIACAVRFARATAADYGGDPTRITLVGNSSGASAGLVVALAGEDYEGHCVENDASPHIDVFIGYEGDYDYVTTHYEGDPDYTKLKEEDPELWNAINPYSHIGRNPELQIRLIHGKDTDVNWYDVPPEVSMELYNTLLDAGYDVELNLLEGAHHTDLTNQARESEAFKFAVQLVRNLIQNPSQ